MTLGLVEEARRCYLRLSRMVTRQLREIGEVDEKLYRVCSKARRRMTNRASRYFEETGKVPWEGDDA